MRRGTGGEVKEEQRPANPTAEAPKSPLPQRASPLDSRLGRYSKAQLATGAVIILLLLVTVIGALNWLRSGGLLAYDVKWPSELEAKRPALLLTLRTALKDSPHVQEPWIWSLQGAAKELIHVAISGQYYVAGFVCRPDDCGNNRMSFLIADDGSKAVAKIQLRRTGVNQTFGKPSPGETAILEQYLR
jgi:hypothetical protein